MDLTAPEPVATEIEPDARGHLASGRISEYAKVSLEYAIQRLGKSEAEFFNTWCSELPKEMQKQGSLPADADLSLSGMFARLNAKHLKKVRRVMPDVDVHVEADKVTVKSAQTAAKAVATRRARKATA